MPYIDIDSNEEVEVRFDQRNIQVIIDEVKRINENSNNHYTKKDIDNLEKSLNFLSKILTKFSLEAYVSEVWIDDYDLKELTKGNYDDGYNDAIDRMEAEQKAITQNHGCLLQKIEHLAYGYGNQDPLTKDEIQKIRDILHDKLRAW